MHAKLFLLLISLSLSLFSQEKPVDSLPVDFLEGYYPIDFSYVVENSKFPKKLLRMHLALYEGYVKNTRLLMQDIQLEETDSYTYGALKRRLNFELSGMRLHEYFFANIGGRGVVRDSPLMDAIIEQFGSYNKWKKAFRDTALIRGIGWSILAKDLLTGKLMNVWIEEHNMGNLIDLEPLLVLDVWEHAYITEFGLDKKSYIQAFFNDIDWSIVEKRFNGFGRSDRFDSPY